MLFMMHMLGTFLAPTSSTTPAEKLLKVLASTINGFARFDWATYIAKDIQKELADYVNAIRGNNNCNSYVGGRCDYNGQHADVDDNGQHLDSDDEGEEGDGDSHDDGEAGYDDDIGTPIHIDESDGGSPIGEGRTKGEQSIVPYQVHQQYAPRRILIQIDDEDLTREQLQTLGRRNKLSNRVMSVVCKTLMKDMQKEGQSLFVTKPSSWKVA
ncbi:hypothetical protein K1719_019910 [Acacia pycnantha]|nr:hypothetical protein K1719_019910 [Acacia pycnantha]